jgi:hypothetical protein
MKIDAVISETLIGVLDKLNELKVQKEDIVTFLQNTKGQYIAIFYQ